MSENMNKVTEFAAGNGSKNEKGVKQMPDTFAAQMEDEFEQVGGAWEPDEGLEDAVGRTMFDTANSRDDIIVVVVPNSKMHLIPARSLVRINSLPTERGGDGRVYVGAVVEGMFAEPDGLRGDAPIIVTTTVRGGVFVPPYHGRVHIEIMGEEIDGKIAPPRFRPLPNSPVFVLSEEEMSQRLGLVGDIGIGYAIGFKDLRVNIPSDKKSVLARHSAFMGTTGGGKSTTVSGQVDQYQKAEMATVIFDTEGEYTRMGRPTEDETMVELLKREKRVPAGIENVHVYHLVGRDTTAERPTPISSFKLEFSDLSPYAAAEILGLTDAQKDRFFKLYDVTKLVLRDLGIFPERGNREQEKQILEIDEFQSGHPHVTLSRLIDVANFFLESLTKKSDGEKSSAGRKKSGAAEVPVEADELSDVGGYQPYNVEFRPAEARGKIKARIHAVSTNNEVSWKSLLSKLWMLHRIGIFDNARANAVPFNELLQPGRVSVIDLSDTDSPIINNLVIAAILRGLQLRQDAAYEAAQKKGGSPTPLMIIIEEAHEFLSRDRIAEMENLYQQVVRIARRGRKRWLGLVFVTQLPQHLPDEILGLVNNFVLHKISDANVISRLKRSVGGIDESLWNRLPNLAPGQAIVSYTSMSRPLLVAVDPTPCKLRMID